MASPAATKRLTREYANITNDPPPYIIAHPSESNILEWHYILTGPPDSPYHNGQYWGSLMFPSNYPFAPPAIRMHTPSGRFQPSQRLCLSISDFHPRSFNPAWEVSTILTGLLSFMTSDEMTTGSVRASDAERRAFARRSRWWNSTGAGSLASPPFTQLSSQSQAYYPQQHQLPTATRTAGGLGAIRGGDSGARFRGEWPDQDKENWTWMRQQHIDPQTGHRREPPPPTSSPSPSSNNALASSNTTSSSSSSTAAKSKSGLGGALSCSPPEAAALRRRPNGVAAGSGLGSAVVGGGQVASQAGQGWLGRNKMVVGLVVVFGYVILARFLGERRVPA